MKEANTAPDLLQNYGFAPVQFCGNVDALFERHLLFDDIIDPMSAGARERF
jgi:glycogen phosphorylase